MMGKVLAQDTPSKYRLDRRLVIGFHDSIGEIRSKVSLLSSTKRNLAYRSTQLKPWRLFEQSNADLILSRSQLGDIM
jgi:hypothetical protein